MEVTDLEKKFFIVISTLYERYLVGLKEKKMLDFDGLLIRAIEEVGDGRTVFQRKDLNAVDAKDLKHIFVDEFQDFSELFYRLIEKIIRNNFDANLFCVGDDWQAINGFAGSELKYFKNFNKFPFIELSDDTDNLSLLTNYRSTANIVSFSNALMIGKGEPGRPASSQSCGLINIVNFDNVTLTEFERNLFKGDKCTPVLLRIIKKVLNRKENLTILSRTNHIPYPVSFMSFKNREQNNSLYDYKNTLFRYIADKEERKDLVYRPPINIGIRG